MQHTPFSPAKPRAAKSPDFAIPKLGGIGLRVLTAVCLLTILLTSCRLPQFGGTVNVTIRADGTDRTAQVPSGSTVTQVLAASGVTVGSLDQVAPPLYAVLNDGDTITVTRVVETFETEDVEIPFERQVVRSESVPAGETMLIQPGENGSEENTIRILTTDGVETSRTVVKTVILKEAVPEITMIGAQSVFTPLTIPGKLVFLAGGNAWLMEDSTANRRPLVTTGDLDGRVFALSPTGAYLLFTRKSKKPADQQINTLWIIRTSGTNPQPVQVSGAANIVHYAGWAPNTTPTFGYSTVEPRATAPGWQANNDFWRVSVIGGSPGNPRKIMDANSGGVYGWWGMSFAWGSDGRLAYARPDGIGLVDQDTGRLRPMMDIAPLETHSDWAWIPPIVWGPDARTLFFGTHAPAPAPFTAEESPYFDLSAVSMINDATVNMVQQTGMFAYPSTSPIRAVGKEKSYQVAFLQAIFPDQSETSRYRLVVMDRDGSNRRTLFPPSDAAGIALKQAQPAVWSPEPIPGQAGDFLAVIYLGNIWFVDTGSSAAYQITGDGLSDRMDWK